MGEYSWLVDEIRRNNTTNDEDGMSSAIDRAISDMPDSFVIRTMIEAHRAGVKKMFLTEYDEEKMKEQERKEAFADGYADGIDAGVAEANERVAADMLKKKYPLDAIKDISRLSEAHIRKLAKSLGVVVL